MNNWKIYKYTNLINGKVYVGQTKRTLSRRSSGKSLMGYSRCTYFWNAIQKYGVENFKSEILVDKINSQEEANRLEQFYIKQYKSNNEKYGYNISSGGNSRDHFCIPVYQYDLYGNYLNEYESAVEASFVTGIHDTSILSVCRGERKTAGNYIWSHDKYNIIKSETFDTRKFKVYKYDLKGNFLQDYNNAFEAGLKFGGDYCAHRIIDGCKKENGQYFGYQWRFYKKDNIGDYSENIPSKKHQGVYKYDLDGNYICFYNTNEEAAKDNNIKNRSSIAACCNKRTYQCGGFQWSYDYVDNIGSYYTKTNNYSQLELYGLKGVS